METPRLVPNVSLRRSDIPDINVRELDPDGFTSGEGASAAEWGALWTFALTFDGYRYFGGDAGAEERLAQFADSVSGARRNTGELPKLDLAHLRACLFYEQRRWNKAGMEYSCPPDAMLYLASLLSAIRASMS